VEGLVILAVVLFFFNAIAKRGKEIQAARQHSQQPVQTEPARNARPATVSPSRKPVSQPMQSRMQSAPIAAEGDSAYRTMRPTVQTGRIGVAYTGSLGAATPEGNASDEGKDVSDPALARDRAIHLHAYAVPDAEQSPVDVLPKQWDGHSIVQSFVMNEILNRPHTGSKKNDG